MADGSVIIDTKLDSGGLKKGLGTIGSIAKTGLKGVAVAVRSSNNSICRISNS